MVKWIISSIINYILKGEKVPPEPNKTIHSDSHKLNGTNHDKSTDLHTPG